MMMNKSLKVVILFAVLLVAGCITRAGVAEYQLYKKTFDESTTVSTALIDRLVVAERSIGQLTSLKSDRLGVDRNFDPNDAIYFSDDGDPPLAAEYRRAIKTINSYNDIMLAYATGQGFDQVLAKALILSNETTALAGAVTGSSIQLTTLNVIAGKLAKLAATERSRAVFQREFKETVPVLINLLDQMRDKTPIMFATLTFFTRAELADVVDGIERGDAAKLRKQHAALRVLLSKWVVLLDRQKHALLATQNAIENPNLGIILSGTTEAVIELRTTIAGIRIELAKQ